MFPVKKLDLSKLVNKLGCVFREIRQDSWEKFWTHQPRNFSHQFAPITFQVTSLHVMKKEIEINIYES